MSTQKPSALQASQVADASDDEFVFALDSPEFTKVMKLFAQWADANDIKSIGNRDDGEIITRRFAAFVEKEHAELAREVERDGTIYEAVVMEWPESE